MSTSLRIKKIASHLGISIGALEKAIGSSKGVLSRSLKNDTDIQSKWLSNLIENYPHFNANWILTGEGNMLLPLSQTQINEPEITYKTPKKTSLDTPGIPLISLNTLKKLNSYQYSILKKEVISYYILPKFNDKKVDFIIEISGDTMAPRFKNGDYIMCTLIKNSNFIQWNKPHAIVTKEQGVLVKRLKQSKTENCLLAVSDNPQYDPFDLPLNEITTIALIVGGIFEE